MARGQQSKRAARRQKAKAHEAKASSPPVAAGAAIAATSRPARPMWQARPVTAIDSPWPLMVPPTPQRKPSVDHATAQRPPIRNRRAQMVQAATQRSTAPAAASANTRAAFLLAFPLLVLTVAMLDRSGALRVIWPVKSPTAVEIASRKSPRLEPAIEAPATTKAPAVADRKKHVTGPIQSRAASDIAAVSRATPLPVDLPPVATRLPAARSLAGPSTHLDQVAQNRSLIRRKASQSSLSGAESQRPTEPETVVAALPAPQRTARPFSLPPPAATLPASPPAIASLTPSPAPARKATEIPAPVALLPTDPPYIAPAPKAAPVAPSPVIAALPVPPPPVLEPQSIPVAPVNPSLVVPRPRAVALIEDTEFGPVVAVPLPRLADPADAQPVPQTTTTPTFGERLAAAAFEQTKKDVTYDPRYVRIAYPMGDVPDYMGVCTDVVIRAYRTLGIDLQELVQKARSGTGDTNIDHRRVLVLRKFLEQHGQSLPISPYPESYKPGDLVTYFKPYGRTSKFHIVVISDRLTPDGRPLVIHNRGYGAKLEDVLFKEKITGHYRFEGLAADAVAAKKSPLLKLHRAAIQPN